MEVDNTHLPCWRFSNPHPVHIIYTDIHCPSPNLMNSVVLCTKSRLLFTCHFEQRRIMGCHDVKEFKRPNGKSYSEFRSGFWSVNSDQFGLVLSSNQSLRCWSFITEVGGRNELPSPVLHVSHDMKLFFQLSSQEPKLVSFFHMPNHFVRLVGLDHTWYVSLHLERERENHTDMQYVYIYFL